MGLVIIIAISFYLFDTYGGEIYSSVKTSVLDILLNDIDSYELIDEDTSLKLKTLAEEQLENIKDLDLSEAYDQLNFFFKEVKLFLKDNKLDEIEFNKLKEIISDEK